MGEEQSGNMNEVGYELYQHMLEEAIAKIRSGELEGLTEYEETWAPQINLGVPVMIPRTTCRIWTCGWAFTAACRT